LLKALSKQGEKQRKDFADPSLDIFT